MKSKYLSFLAFSICLIYGHQPVNAQFVTTSPTQITYNGATNPVDFEFRQDGVLVAKGNYGVGTLGSSDQGAGTRLLWFPKLAAFRAGGVSGTQWDSANIGGYSVAFGLDNTASGLYSAASGYGNSAIGSSSVAMGLNNTTTGNYSVALGMGNFAYGSGSVAIGGGSKSYATYSFSSGITEADAYASVTFGRYNVGGGTGGSWVTTDPLFELGNGLSSSATSNAFVVYKDGTAAFQGTVTVGAGGDVPMFTGN